MERRLHGSIYVTVHHRVLRSFVAVVVCCSNMLPQCVAVVCCSGVLQWCVAVVSRRIHGSICIYVERTVDPYDVNREGERIEKERVQE